MLLVDFRLIFIFFSPHLEDEKNRGKIEFSCCRSSLFITTNFLRAQCSKKISIQTLLNYRYVYNLIAMKRKQCDLVGLFVELATFFPRHYNWLTDADNRMADSFEYVLIIAY